MNTSRQRLALDLPAYSLLSPDARQTTTLPDTGWVRDLGLESFIPAFAHDSNYVVTLRGILSNLNTDPAVIAWRQAALTDFWQSPALVETVAQLLPRLADLRIGNRMLGRQKRALLLEVADRIDELENYLHIVTDLHNALTTAPIRSAALIGLRERLTIIMNDENFKALRAEIPELQRPLRKLASATFAINLDENMHPLSVVLLGIHDRPFSAPRSFLARLIGPNEEADEAGIAPLHFTPEQREQRPLSPLFQDLDNLMTQAITPVSRALNRYMRISAAPLAGLEQELAFYLSGVRLGKVLQAAGVPICLPEIAPPEARISRIEGLVNLNLALRRADPLVANDAYFDDTGRIAILTGPNSGGKTTYLQAVGLAHAFFAAGLFIPAKAATISPPDAILTHFPALETQQEGRLAEEAARLRSVFLSASDRSLVLLNESLSSTIAGEALYLAHDVLCALRAIGVRAIYATHLIDLAERLDDVHNAIEGPSTLFSLVAGVRFTNDSPDAAPLPTFQITRGRPMGRGYAREIARRHGISLEQIMAARQAPR